MILLVSLIIPSVIEPRFTLLFYSPLQLQPDSSHTSTPCQVLPMFKDRESTASLGSLFQCFTTFTENCFSLYLIMISQAVTYIHCLSLSNSKRNLILYCLLSPTVQLRQQPDPAAAFSPRLHKASSLNITFHTKMLQPPPFLGNPSLDLLSLSVEWLTLNTALLAAAVSRTMRKNGLPQTPGTLVHPTMWLVLLLEKSFIPFPSIPNKNQVPGCKIFIQYNPEFPLSRVKHNILLPYKENGSVIKDNYQVYKEPRLAPDCIC